MGIAGKRAHSEGVSAVARECCQRPARLGGSVCCVSVLCQLTGPLPGPLCLCFWGCSPRGGAWTWTQSSRVWVRRVRSVWVQLLSACWVGRVYCGLFTEEQQTLSGRRGYASKEIK